MGSFPFFKKRDIEAWLRVGGSEPCSWASLYTERRRGANFFSHFLKNSVENLSGPGALLLCMTLKESIISSSDKGASSPSVIRESTTGDFRF